MLATMLKGKVAIVTGSTSGIGLGIAKSLAAQGVDIVLNGFGDAHEIETIRNDLERAHGIRTGYSNADMSKGDAVRVLIELVSEMIGRVDILVNNAGIQFTAPIEAFRPRSGTPSWRSICRRPSMALRLPCRDERSKAGAGSSTLPRRTAWSARPIRPPMSRRSTASSA